MTAGSTTETRVDLVDVGCDEAGAALLGAALESSQPARDAVAQLAVEDLTDTRQRAVLEAVHKLIEADTPIDPVTVLGEMRAEGTEVRMPCDREAGVYLCDLLARAGVAGPDYYLTIIRQHALRRSARALGRRATQAAGTSSLADLVTMIRDDTIRLLAAAKRAGVDL